MICGASLGEGASSSDFAKNGFFGFALKGRGFKPGNKRHKQNAGFTVAEKRHPRASGLKALTETKGIIAALKTLHHPNSESFGNLFSP